MRKQFITESLREQDKQAFEQYVETKLERLEKALAPYHFDEDSVKLQLHVEHAKKHNSYLLKITLDIPRNSFHHQEAKHHLNEVLDLSFDNIIKQLRHYQEKRREY